MKERPIIMSAESVRAILAGIKTQTRRVIEPQPTCFRKGSRPELVTENGVLWLRDFDFGIKLGWQVGPCPYGGVGDRLWVRETFTVLAVYRAEFPDNAGIAWDSPLVMPRWASRITLEITGVRVQRVQEISEDDCIAEGVDIDFPPHEADQPTPKMLYERLWDSINSKRGYPWASNPWVWAITFKRI
jgi:hypothetical protein